MSPLTGKSLARARSMEGIWENEGYRMEVVVEDGVLLARSVETGSEVPVGYALTGRMIERKAAKE